MGGFWWFFLTGLRVVAAPPSSESVQVLIDTGELTVQVELLEFDVFVECEP
jgi:hypothetical protein